MLIPVLTIVAIATSLVVAANLVSAWLIDLFGATSEFQKRASALIGSALVTVGVRYIGYAALVSVLTVFSPETNFPAEPDIPVDFSTMNWILVALFTWATSGGVVDLRKYLAKVRR